MNQKPFIIQDLKSDTGEVRDARQIGGGGGGSGTDSNAVHYNAADGKNSTEQAQALANAGAEPKKLVVTVTESGGVYSGDTTFSAIHAALVADRTVLVVDGNDYVYHVEYISDDYISFVNENVSSNASGGQLIVMYFGVDDTNTWLKREREYIPAPTTVIDLSSTSITLASAANNTIYECGELSALTVTAIDASGDFIIRFTSGATATVLTVPNSMIMPDGFTVEANTRYEINCSNGYALVAGWAVSA